MEQTERFLILQTHKDVRVVLEDDIFSAAMEMEEVLLDFLSESWMKDLDEFHIMKKLKVSVQKWLSWHSRPHTWSQSLPIA